MIDPCTKTILDFISIGESNGNYNAVIGNAKSTDDLSKYTITQIYGLMDQLLKKGRPSTAIGRYQIIRATLKTLIARKSLPGTTYFTPALQDDLGVALLVGRGYQSWWRGVISNQEFAHQISMEWASLPDPNANGKSHYDGVGPNHASRTLKEVYAMLDAARKLIP